jgi:DNA-directed RNA polymerase subunit RPC12/RpoP
VNTGKQTRNGHSVGTVVSSQVVTEESVKNESDLDIEKTHLHIKDGPSLQHEEQRPVEREPAFHNTAPHTDRNTKEDCRGTSDDTAYLLDRCYMPDNAAIPYHDSDMDSGKSEMGFDQIKYDDKPANRKHKITSFGNLKDFNKSHNKLETSDCKTYGCSKCGKTFSYTSKFTFHTCNLTPEKRFVCNLCGKDYSTAGAVKTHLHIHKGKHKCPTCGKSFPSKFQVEVHMRIHTGEKPYVCEYCGKRFAYDKGLTLHMSVHTGIKPYKCDECNYSTTSRSYIKNHKSVHRAEKPFVCEICGQGYTLLPSLMNHQLNHSDQKTYTCEMCNKAFNTSRNLASHKRMHSGMRPYHCEECGKRFARKEGLKEHKVIHTGEKKFVCLICEKQFAWRKTLRTHRCGGASDCK